MYNPNTFFLNLKQRTVLKAVEDALRYIKMYVTGVSVKTERVLFLKKKSRGTSHSTSEQGLEHLTVLLKLQSTLLRIARLEIGVCFKN